MDNKNTLFNKTITLKEDVSDASNSDAENWIKFLEKYSCPTTIKFADILSKTNQLKIELPEQSSIELESEIFFLICRGYSVYIAEKDIQPFRTLDFTLEEMQENFKVIHGIINASQKLSDNCVQVLNIFALSIFELLKEKDVVLFPSDVASKKFLLSQLIFGYYLGIIEEALSTKN